MNIKLINYLESKGIDIYFDEDSYEKYDLEKYQIGRGYEPKFIELMNTNPMSYNTHMFKTKDIKEILLYEDEIVVAVETKASKYDRRFVRFDFDIEPLLKEVKEQNNLDFSGVYDLKKIIERLKWIDFNIEVLDKKEIELWITDILDNSVED